MTLTTPKQLVKAYEQHGSLKAAGRATKTSWFMVHKLYQQAMAEGLIEKLPRGSKRREHIADTVKGKVKAKPVVGGKRRARRAVPLPIKAKGVTRFLFTCAQNNTKLHEPFWNNLRVLQEHYKAELHISRFAYIKSGLGARGDKKHWFESQQGGSQHNKEFWFDPRIEPYLSDEPRMVAPGLIWRGDYNILPTASRPLSGLKTVTGRKSGIFPHVKIAMDSVPSMEHNAVKFNYTTGTITERNYIARKEGLKAEFHHTYGALLVEVDGGGDWWCRQINADSEGTIYDLDICVKKGELTTGNAVEAIVWGDVHVANIDENVEEGAWGEGGMLDYLRPKQQFIHDVLDFYSRSHHEIDDPHQLLLRYTKRKDSVRNECEEVFAFLDFASRDWCKTQVVNSNHDRHLLKWLKNHTAMRDPVNFQFWTELNARVNACIVDSGDFPVILREAYFAITGSGKEPARLHFLAQDESCIVCPDRSDGIECGAHGDEGNNGARGSTASFAILGRRVTKAHDHTAAIIDGVHSVGTCRKLRVDTADYVHGPSAWSHSQDVIYPNGKRAIITFWHGRPWADR